MRPAPVALLTVTLLLVGCGNPRTQPLPLNVPLKPSGFSTFREKGGDVSLPQPEGWAGQVGPPPRVITLSSGHAVITVWAYRQPAVPANATEAELARKLLFRSLRRRATDFAIAASRVTTARGLPAVEIEGRGAISGRKVRVRTVHLYKGAAEYVIDAYADPNQFALADRLAFSRIIRGIRVRGQPERIGAGAPKRQTP